MKKILYTLLLLNQLALHGMEEKASQSDKQIAVFQSMDPAIKEDISTDDPLAFEKIVRYADILSIEFNRCLKESDKANPKIVEKAKNVPAMLENIKNGYKHMRQGTTGDAAPDIVELDKQMDTENILLWNEFKNQLLQMLELLKK